MAASDTIMNGPIPGENYTSDTRNYPWHRPPEFEDLNEAVEWSMEKLTDEHGSMGLLSLIQAGMTIAEATDIFVTSGIGKGKWTPDYAILLAGPIARIIEMMAKGYEIKYDMGIDKAPPVTFEYIKALQNTKTMNKEKANKAVDAVAESLGSPESPPSSTSKKRGGFMAVDPQEDITDGDI
tara:strand:- start:2210 stop:2752 length:543 start_codon:yes stop_codon:yes gene_type:complete